LDKHRHSFGAKSIIRLIQQWLRLYPGKCKRSKGFHLPFFIWKWKFLRKDRNRTDKWQWHKRLVYRLYRNRWQRILFCQQYPVQQKCHRQQSIRVLILRLIRYGYMGRV